MCGIMGLVLGNTESAAAPELLEAGILLQHRCQDAAGIATSDKSGHSYLHKGDGLITEVFGTKGVETSQLKGSMGLGHCEYIQSIITKLCTIIVFVILIPKFPSAIPHCWPTTQL